jgi:hypothetical protein
MGYSSQPGQVGFGLQASRGTDVPATCFARLRSGSLGGDRSLLIPDPEIGGNRDIPQAYLGPVAFSGDLEFYPRMRMAAMLLYGVMGAKSSNSVAGTNEVQTITITGTPTGGTFKLRFRGQTTTALDFDSTSSEIDTALEALGAIAPGEVTCAGGPLPGSAVTVTFSGQYAAENVPMIEPVDVALTGGTAPAVAVTASTPGVPAIGTHVITPADTLPWITVEERVSVGFESFQYTDAQVNSLRLEADATGFLMGTASLAALSQTSGFTEQTDPAWDTSPMIVGSQIEVSFNGSPFLGAKSMNFEINNNMELDDFNLGSIFVADMTPKRREVRAGITYRPQDADLWRGAMYGDPSYTTPQAGPAYEGPLQLRVSSIETIGDIVAGTPFSLTIDIPHAAVTPFKVNPSGDDVIQNDIEIVALRPDNLVPIVTATIVNDLATVV